MAYSSHVVKSPLTAVSASGPRTKRGVLGPRSGFWSPPPQLSGSGRWRVSCKAQDGDRQSGGTENWGRIWWKMTCHDSQFSWLLCKIDHDCITIGEEPPESLFMKELRRRGMTPTSILEETKKINDGSDDGVLEERDFSRSNAVSTEQWTNLTNQREQLMALNSEGLEGLVPRAKLLLTLGSTFFLAFGPLILITVAFFSVLYLYFGPAFIHDASERQESIPQYVDPYALLDDERISQMSPPIN